MGVFVKVCGIANPDDAMAVAELGPDAMGFIFWPNSERSVDPDQVATWVKDLPTKSWKVGVFVDEPVASIQRTVEMVGLDVVQCHGTETPIDCKKIGGTTWKVVHLSRTEFVSTRDYPVDAFLVDSYSATAPGGTGQMADWALAEQFVGYSDKPVLLAGGLTPENVAAAIQTVQPWGVDVSSGVEQAPGKKDIEKVRRFIDVCRH